MAKSTYLKAALAGSVSALVLASGAFASDYNIPGGDLKNALDSYAQQTAVALLYPEEAIRGVHTRGAKGDLSARDALSRILAGTGFVMRLHPDGAITIVHDEKKGSDASLPVVRLADAAPRPSLAAGIESVVVTSSKIKGDIQTVPIAITALSQEQLTSRQIAGGPDLVKEVPNLTFSKTNFTGYNIQIRGIGTQAISVTTDPAVAVAFNDIPFIRNHFFEQEFYDVGQVEVLRGPQGTLYGRNATAGVVNVISAKPTDQFEAMASADIGNYHNRRYEGMINIPVVDDRLDIRAAGEWTKRDGYSFNELTNAPIDGRDLWSSRITIDWKPSPNLQAYLVWEHFSEKDDRIRSAKQLCKTDPGLSEVNGVPMDPTIKDQTLSQGCLPTSLYSAEAFELPNGLSLPYYNALGCCALNALGINGQGIDPYTDIIQSRNLRSIQSMINPSYTAKNDVVEFNADYAVTPNLTLTSQTAYNQDFLYSTEDYNRFNTVPGVFRYQGIQEGSPRPGTVVSPEGVFCDPQLGCSNRLVVEDLSDEHAWQLSQELRLASNFGGPFNFSIGGNYLHYETEENYYVFFNSLTLLTSVPAFGNTSALGAWVPNVSDNHECLQDGAPGYNPPEFRYPDPSIGSGVLRCSYIDPNPIDKVNNQGHNYFLSQNPYVLNSYAAFGEGYFSITPDLKLITGLRWTTDQKHFVNIPSELLIAGYGYPSTGSIDQQWGKFTGRFAANWSPKLDFTDQTLIYGSYAHGYKAGGANPPGAVLLVYLSSDIANPTHPLTFKPEYVESFEVGSKNTLLDGSLTLNATAFYYNYLNYQISYIVDRTSVNLNFNAHVKGAEVEATWEPAPGLRFNFAGGWEDTALAKGDKAVDLIDRTAGNPDWIVVKPFVTQASNCILPAYVVALGGLNCGAAYGQHIDPITRLPYVANPTVECDSSPSPNDPTNSTCSDFVAAPANYPGFDPSSAPNNGTGFYKDLSGNKLPNAPPFTLSMGAQYTLPVSSDWAATLRSDFYWQDSSWARVWNDDPYDRLRGYTNFNLALILTSENGWQVMLYDKNVFNTTAITGTFLNSDDSGLTTNVFLTDPRLIGVRVTKNW